MKKWSAKLKSQSEVHFANLAGVLLRQQKQRGFTSRALRKRRAAAALAALCVEAPDPQLKNVIITIHYYLLFVSQIIILLDILKVIFSFSGMSQ